MLCKTASYNDGGSTYNAFATESAFRSYKIIHEFNEPALLIVELGDPTGAIFQKYNVDANDVYVGPGKIQIEDPDETKVFEGRIVQARYNSDRQRTFLYCYDWLHQLTDDRVNYDLRKDLGSGVRESQLKTDWDSGGYKYAIYTTGTDYYVCDEDMSWDADEWNNMFLVFSHKLFGRRTVSCGPFDEIITPDSGAMDTDTPANGEENLWDDTYQAHRWADNDDAFDVVYKFDPQLNDSSLVTTFHGATVDYNIYWQGAQTGIIKVYFYDFNGAAWVELATITNPTQNQFMTGSWTVPKHFVRKDYFMDHQFWLLIECEVDGTIDIDCMVYDLVLNVDVTTTGTSSAYEVLSNDDVRLKIDTDLSATGAGLFEQAEYSIVDYIKNYLNAFVTAHDPLVTLTTSIEATDGICMRHYHERRPLEVLKDLALYDKTVFWLKLGLLEVQWKRTFNDGSPTAVTDADVISWGPASYDYLLMENEEHVYGIRIGDEQVYVNTGDLGTDPGADSKSTYGVTRAGVIKSSGTYNEYEAEELGKVEVERKEDVLLVLEATLGGFTSLRLGDEISITSTMLNLSSANYVVMRMEYDSKNYRSRLVLHPRQSIGYINYITFGEEARHEAMRNRELYSDLYLPTLAGETWT